ncbi:MAG: prenyltransferase/squalene oxidase repeat-containing protein [Anaerolineae bacterium]
MQPSRTAFRPAAAALLGLFLLVILLGLTASPSTAQDSNQPFATQTGPNQADIVVDLGDGRTIARHIVFTQTTVSGLQALRLTGLNVTTADFSFGSAVCAIEGVGCPATNCFCNANKFWGYKYWDGAAWQNYMIGASASTIGNGAVDGWIWGRSGSALPAVSPEILAANAALQWMRPQQAANGSFNNNVGATVDVILAVAAANQRPEAWRGASGASLVDFVQSRAAQFAGQSAAAAGKLAVGVAAADRDPARFGNLNLVQSINATYTPATGAYGANNQDQAWAMLGLAAAKADVPAAAVQRLATRANTDGGWGWAAGVASDVDTTALAVQALLAAGAPLNSPAVVNALAYLHSVQQTNDNGGFASSPEQAWGVQSNTNSTAFAIQGLLAASQDPISVTWTISNATPVDFLLGQQLPSGAMVYIAPPAPDLFATQQAVPALVGKPYPLLSRAVALRRGLAWIAAQQQPDGSFAGFNPGATIDAVLAIAAAGADPNTFSAGNNTPLTYLTAQAGSYAAQGASAAGKLTVGVVAGRGNPRAFGGEDLVAKLQSLYQAGSGQYGLGSVWDQAFAMLGLAAAGQPIPANAVTYLVNAAATGGGWAFDVAAAAADVDSTGLALQALAAAGVTQDHAAVRAGLAFLHTAQNNDGGFPGYGGATDPASTGLALQGLAAYAQNPRGLAWTTQIADGSASRLTLHTPVDALLALQSPAGGFPGYSGPNDPFSTYQALAGLTGQPLPLHPPQQRFFPIILKH